MGASRKGGAFERELSKALSLWWTDGERDDVFWRTSQSGGRATVRARKGKTTYGQHGDLQAVDPVGAPLTRLLSIEAKRGYRDAHVGNALDCKPGNKPKGWDEFVAQAQRECREAGIPFWFLIVRRNGRQALVYFPQALYQELRYEGALFFTARPFCRVRTDNVKGEVVGTTLAQFLKRVTPRMIRNISRDYR